MTLCAIPSFPSGGAGRRRLAGALAFAVMLPFAAVAQNNPFTLPSGGPTSTISGTITGSSAQQVLEIARAYGPAELRPATGERAEWIRGEIDGMIYTISFLNCEQGRNCSSLQIRAWWTSDGAHTLEALNQWNNDRRFSSAYLDNEGNATIEFDVNLAHGIPAANFDDTMQWWRAVLRQFNEQVIEPGYAAHGGAAPEPGGQGTAPVK